MTTINQVLDKFRDLEVCPQVQAEIDSYLGKLKKEISKKDFMIESIRKEKNISGQFLNITILDLQEKSKEIDRVNDRLLAQKKEIEVKNLELMKQKILVDNQKEMLQQKFQELENSYAELEQFSYIASHDLKSPLRNIGTFARLLQKKMDGKLGPQEIEFMDFIVKGTQQMSSIIDDLLKYSRVGVKDGDFQMLDINEVLDLVKFNLTHDVNENDVLLEIAEMPSALFANRSSLIQIFQNLISNAIKFKADRRPHIKVGVEETTDFYIFSVKDNGVGMEEKFQQKAFEPFQRLNNQERPGTGMGLAICRKIAMLHNGDIRFESELGMGTDFYFRISKKMDNQLKVEKILAETSN